MVTFARTVSRPPAFELLVGPVALDVRPPLADAGDPDRVVRPVHLLQPVERLLLGDRPGRQELRGQPLRVLQHAGRLAVGPLDDLAAGRVRGVAGDARGLEGGRVEHLHLPGGVLPVEHDRAVRGGRVEVGPGRHPPLPDAGDVHPREPDPLPGGGRRRLLPHPLLDLGDRAELDERLDRLPAAGADGVDVGLDQPGDDRLAAGVDHPGLVADQRLDVGVGPDLHEHPVPDGDRLGGGELRIDRQHLAVADDEVGRRFGGPEGGRTGGQAAQGERGAEGVGHG